MILKYSRATKKRKFHSTDLDSLHTIGGSGPISLVATETSHASANAVLTRRRRQLARVSACSACTVRIAVRGNSAQKAELD